MNTNLKFTSILLIIGSIFIFSGCSSKQEVAEYNKPALYWYNKMLDQLSNFQIDEADDTYTSLESEHRNSPLIATSLLILANAHIDEEEYALANFYLDEYDKRFSVSKNIDYVRYLKIKANFLGFKYQLRNQELVEKTLRSIASFKKEYPRSPYMPLVDTINSRLYMSKVVFDKEIADLYTRIDKPKGSKVYMKKVNESWMKMNEIKKVDVPFYRSIFE